jgi:hypothetical protein
VTVGLGLCGTLTATTSDRFDEVTSRLPDVLRAAGFDRDIVREPVGGQTVVSGHDATGREARIYLTQLSTDVSIGVYVTDLPLVSSPSSKVSQPSGTK